jgi:hypothetical protein
MNLPRLTLREGGQFELFEDLSDAPALRSMPRSMPRLRRARLRHDPQIVLISRNPYTWTERDIFTLLERYLRRRLRLLRDGRASEARRQRVINWVAAPILPWPQACKQPLSFQACCYAWPADPESSREKILRRVAPERLRDLE